MQSAAQAKVRAMSGPNRRRPRRRAQKFLRGVVHGNPIRQRLQEGRNAGRRSRRGQVHVLDAGEAEGRLESPTGPRPHLPQLRRRAKIVTVLRRSELGSREFSIDGWHRACRHCEHGWATLVGGWGTIGDAGGPVASGRGGQPSPRIWRRLATGRSRMPHGTMRPKPCV